MKKADTTRLMILQKAFELIYARGYQMTSIDEIIATTQVTKGAFYYHFKTKDAMGMAIINEILRPSLLKSFIEPLNKEQDPTKAIYSLLYQLLLDNKFLKVQYGCPAANFIQEMSPWNTGFKKILDELTLEWVKVIAAKIEKGKRNGFIRKDVHAKQVTRFVLAGYWGIRNFGKLENNIAVYRPYLKELKNYLAGLK